MLCIAQCAAAQLALAGLKQCSPTSPGSPALLGAPQGGAASEFSRQGKKLRLVVVCRQGKTQHFSS